MTTSRLTKDHQTANDQRAARAAGQDDAARVRESRDAIAAMLQNVDSAVSSYSVPGRRFLYMSRAAERIYGVPACELDGTDETWRRIVHPEDRDAFFAARDRMLRDGAAQLDYRVVHGDGTVRWVHHRANVAYDRDGAPLRIDSVATDVTETYEQRAQLARLSRIRDVLSAVNSALVRTHEPEAVCRQTCEIATRVGGLPAAAVVLFDAERRTAEVAAIVGNLSHDVVGAHARRTLTDLGSEPGVLAASMRAHRPVVENDIEPSVGVVPGREKLFRAGTRSVASFPFTVDDTRSGSLVLTSNERDFFSADEIELLSSLAINLGFALELGLKRRRLEYLARYDPLTELANRTLALDRLDAAIGVANGSGARVALMLIDVRGFAALNSTLGHAAGDEILRAFGQRLADTAGPARAARIGADRFAIIVPKLNDVRDLLQSLGPDGLALLSTPIHASGRELPISAHVGCAMYPDDGRDANALLRAAEAALHAAKSDGAAYRFYSPDLDAQLRNRVDLEGRLRRAAADEQFVLHYQPKIDLASRRITGVEALIRWCDPARANGLVPPLEFIPALEHMGLIVDVGRWALREAARQFDAWRRAALDAPRIAVNVSAVQLRSAQFLRDIDEAIALHGGPCGLDIEITESAVMQDMRLAADVLREIGARGVGIAMDDFGTGYSSLSHLFQLPIGSVKIDRTFIDGVTRDDTKNTIVSTVISLARQLRLNVVAEGVETEDQARLLRTLGCDEAQGYLIGRPMPADQLASRLRAA